MSHKNGMGTFKTLFYLLIIMIVLTHWKDLLALSIYILMIIGSIYVIYLIIKRVKTNIKLKKIANSEIYEIDNMSGSEFEDFLEAFFKKSLSYKVIKKTNISNDYGADIIVKDNSNNKKIAVQAKRYNNNVSISAVQEVNSAIDYYNCDEGLVITNSNLTKSAQKLVDKISNVDYWARNKLIKKLNQFNNNN